jgi:multicomponent Na+:H+ antiporter subunit E
MDARARWRLIRFLLTFGVLCGFWFLFSGSFSFFSLLSGFVCSAAVAALTYDVFIEEHEAARSAVFPRILPALAYPFKLLWTMYASSFRVLLSVVAGKAAPRVVHFRSRLRSDLARVVLSQSITFTPGTIVIDLDEDHLVVHWLNATTRHSSRAGEEIKGALERVIGRIWH